MNSTFPKILYRGDSDKEDNRLLRTTLKSLYLCTNLIKGGNGSVIFKEPLVELVKAHINGWGKTHFLSFSESEDTATEYGSHGLNLQYNDPDRVNYALLKFHPDKVLKWQGKNDGVYKGYYSSSMIKFPNGCWLYLIDTVTYLKANIHLGTAAQLSLATGDKEWLILPANAELFNNGVVEYSTQLDMSDIIEYEQH
jgi:hypothetical protein